jgi:transmembrane protein
MQQAIVNGMANVRHPSTFAETINGLVDAILTSQALFAFGRVLITFMYWYAGIGFLLNFSGAVVQMRALGLEPAAFIAALTIAVELIGSALIIDGRLAWFGAGMLGVFTVATIPLIHDFWNMTGLAATQAMLESEEHLTVVGGLLAVAILCHLERKLRSATAPSA